MTTEEKISLLADIMELEPDELDLGMMLEEIEEWDSLSKLAFMAKTKKLYGTSVSVDEMKEFKTVKDIIDYLK